MLKTFCWLWWFTPVISAETGAVAGGQPGLHKTLSQEQREKEEENEEREGDMGRHLSQVFAVQACGKAGHGGTHL